MNRIAIKGQRLGLLITIVVTVLVTALVFLAVARQDAAKSNSDRLVDLAEQNRESLAILRCSSGVTVLIPASDPDWRLRAYKRCLTLNTVPEVDPKVQVAVEETREPGKA